MMLSYLLPIILYLGIITSLTDIRKNEIKNMHIIAAFIIGFLIYMIAGFVTHDFFQIIKQFGLGLIGIIIGFILWHFGFWGAGDAKLYSAYVFLIPIETYKYAIVSISPVFEILINSFVVAMIFLGIQLIKKTSIIEKKDAFIATFHPKRIALSTLTIFGLSWITSIILEKLNVETNVLVNTFFLMALSVLIEKAWTKNSKYYIYSVLAIINILINFSKMISVDYFISLAISVLIFSAIMIFINNLSKIFIVEKKIEDIKEGMYLVDIPIENKKIEQKSIFKKLFSKKKFLLPNRSEGITKTDINKLKKQKILSVRVYQTTHFAPFFLIGFLITIIAGGNLGIWLKAVFF